MQYVRLPELGDRFWFEFLISHFNSFTIIPKVYIGNPNVPNSYKIILGKQKHFAFETTVVVHLEKGQRFNK